MTSRRVIVDSSTDRMIAKWAPVWSLLGTRRPRSSWAEILSDPRLSWNEPSPWIRIEEAWRRIALRDRWSGELLYLDGRWARIRATRTPFLVTIWAWP